MERRCILCGSVSKKAQEERLREVFSASSEGKGAQETDTRAQKADERRSSEKEHRSKNRHHKKRPIVVLTLFSPNKKRYTPVKRRKRGR